MTANATTLKLAIGQVMCHGDSAGGSLCVQGGYYSGLYPSSGDPGTALYTSQTSHFTSVISEFGPSIYGYPPLTSALVAANPVNSPDTLLVQGTLDTRVVPENSDDIYNTLVSNHRPATEIDFPGGHEFAGLTADQITAIRNQELQWSRRHMNYFGLPVSSP